MSSSRLLLAVSRREQRHQLLRLARPTCPLVARTLCSVPRWTAERATRGDYSGSKPTAFAVHHGRRGGCSRFLGAAADTSSPEKEANGEKEARDGGGDVRGRFGDGSTTTSTIDIDITGNPSFPGDVGGPVGLPSRSEQVRKLRESSSGGGSPYDVLIIGGGATGAGCALDASTRGDGKLRVACIERGDFASETSSRSTKLIWAGIRYIATASASLLSKKLLTNPAETVRDFWGEMTMVINCHRERRYMLEKQGHLCDWIPIAVPFTRWVVWPPPFGHALFSLFPVLAPFVFKFYDSLSKFSCPPSYVMGRKRAQNAFPQLSDRDIKYCAVFYEAQHNDARTNVAIALSAAEHGADIANYVEMTGVLYDDETGRATGVRARDRMTGDEFDILANKIIFSGGPFTDQLRQIEADDESSSSSSSKEMKTAVSAASGTHVVLPGYYCPKDMGLLDYNTSDGRFLFFLPWQGHTLVGTTDVKCPAETLPRPPEDEVQWLLNECGRYLSKDLSVRRSDVLSSWRGWRPLAVDPHAPEGAPASRDHVISENPDTGIIFIAGGKWTTWREMAQDVVDRVTDKKCRTLDVTLYGGEGYSSNLSVRLIQKHGMAQHVADHLARTYGGRAWEVCELSQPTNQSWPRFGVPLAPGAGGGYPYIDAEVAFACREYACTIEDVLSRRTRLAFLNKDAALSALPRVADLMAEELGWSPKIKAEQTYAAEKYLESYGGRIPNKAGSRLRDATYSDVIDVFNAIDTDGSGFLDRTEVGEVASVLGFPLTEEQISSAFAGMDTSKDGRVSLEEFEAWWNHAEDCDFRDGLSGELMVGGKRDVDLKNIGPGSMLG